MSRCTACASAIPADAEFCPVCAAPAPEQAAPPSHAGPVAPPADRVAPESDSVTGDAERTAAAGAAGERGAAEKAAVEDEPPGTRQSVWGRLFGRRRPPRSELSGPAPSQAPARATSTPAPAPPPPPPAAIPARRPVEISPEIIAAVPGFSREPHEGEAPAPPPDAPAPAEAAPQPASPQPASPQPAAPPLAELESVEPEPIDADAEPPHVVPSAASPADDVDRTRLSTAASSGPLVLVLPGGERLEVAGAGVLGRNPAAIVGHEVTHVVPVADPTRSVSKTHLGFGVDAVGLWVKDLHSTNGTAVRSPEGVRTLLQPGLAVHVAEGDVVVVGDVELEVTR